MLLQDPWTRARETTNDFLVRPEAEPLWTPFPGPQTLAYESKAHEIFFGGSAGGGKMLDLATPVPTPDGWKTIGSIKEGDLVFTEKGEGCRVSVVHPIDPSPDSFCLEFDDGSKINACADHLWLTFNAKELLQMTKRTDSFRANRRKARASRVSGNKSHKFTLMIQERNRNNPPISLPKPSGSIRTTKEIADTLFVRGGTRKNHAIPVCMPLQCQEVELPIPPYVLGVWLGDGNSRDARITTADKEILEQIIISGETVGPPLKSNSGKARLYLIGGKSKGKEGLQTRLRALGVSNNKHVPSIYLRGSIGQRLELLQGLMDTDGWSDKNGRVSFCNTNVKIIEAATELVRSLGLKVSVSSKIPTLYGKKCKRCFILTWRSSDLPMFRLSRKLARQRTKTRRTTRFRYVVSCKRIDPIPMRCITVDNPTGMFLVGKEMIPTHNTAGAIGLALTKHRRSLILRRTAVNTVEIVDQLKRFGGPTSTWRSMGHGGTLRTADGRVIEVGGCETEDDKEKYSGRPHDLLCFDEAPQFTRSQVRFISAWNRHEDPNQFCRIFLAGNPPTSPEGRWIVEEFAPWLDMEYPNPAKPGELRWFSFLEGKLTWLENGETFIHKGERIVPKSRTFIPAKLTDNPVWNDSDYGSKLQALPEPLRSQLLYGDFTVGLDDDAFQVIPTDWVRKAMARWRPDPPDIPQTSMGVDVARGGRDKTVIAKRHGPWYAPLRKFPGTATPDGPTVAALVMQEHKDDSLVNVDVIGVGSSVFDQLKGLGWFKSVAAINNAAGAPSARDRSGKLKFTNVRAASYWQLRESLDPNGEERIMLPPDNELLADLCAPRYKLLASGIQIEKKEEIIERIGRSPDCADAVVLCHFNVHRPKVSLQILRFGGDKKQKLSLVVTSESVDVSQRSLLFTFLEPGQPVPEHGASALLERVVLEFADIDPKDYQSSWQTPVAGYNRLPEEIKMQPDHGKRLWSAILRKRTVGPEVLIFQGGERVTLSAAMAVCDGLRLKRAEVIYKPAAPEWKSGDKEKPGNQYIYDTLVAAKGRVVV